VIKSARLQRQTHQKLFVARAPAETSVELMTALPHISWLDLEQGKRRTGRGGEKRGTDRKRYRPTVSSKTPAPMAVTHAKTELGAYYKCFPERLFLTTAGYNCRCVLDMESG